MAALRADARWVIWFIEADSPATADVVYPTARQWLRQSLESWRTHYHDGDEADPMVRAGQVLYHVGHIALAVNIRVLFTAAGSESRDGQAPQTW
jgi:hypothetical protein